MRRLTWLLWLICVVALLGGCSMVKLSYRSADTLTLRWLNRYTDLDAAQEAFAEQRLQDFFVWHRTTQLPDYANWLAASRSVLQQATVTQADILAINTAVSARLESATTRALPAVAALTMQLRPAQIDAIAAKFARNNADYKKDFLDIDDEERQLARYKSVLWLAEVLFGSFSSEQEATIRRASDARPLMNQSWMEERIARQRDLLAVLRRIQSERPPLDTVQALLKVQALRAIGTTRIADPAARARAESIRAHAAQLAATIVNLTTPDQKQRASAKLTQWANDLKDLSRD